MVTKDDRPPVSHAGAAALWRGPHSPLPTKRDLLKTKVLSPFAKAEKASLSSVFHGKFFRCSQATANLTAAKRASRNIEFSTK
jgi:hypothetical protein